MSYAKSLVAAALAVTIMAGKVSGQDADSQMVVIPESSVTTASEAAPASPQGENVCEAETTAAPAAVPPRVIVDHHTTQVVKKFYITDQKAMRAVAKVNQKVSDLEAKVDQHRWDSIQRDNNLAGAISTSKQMALNAQATGTANSQELAKQKQKHNDDVGAIAFLLVGGMVVTVIVVIVMAVVAAILALR